MTPHILIVEDEKNLGLTLKQYLETKKFSCDLAESVAQAKEKFTVKKPHIILMDIGLPDGNGIDLAKDLKEQSPSSVLLFLSALNDPQTKVTGLEIGAEDYITKPFDLRELNFRLDRILKSHPELIQDNLIFGKLKINFNSYVITDASGNEQGLNQKEMSILKYLFEKPQMAVSREELISNIWGEEAYPSNRTIDNYIVKLRKWCDTDPEGVISIESVRGVGYKLSKKEMS